MRIESFLLLVAFATPGLALRGEKLSRQLRFGEDTDVFKGEKAEPKDNPKAKDVLGPKEEKKEAKKDKDQEDKEDKKDKKCKKAKKAKKGKEPKQPDEIRRYAEVIFKDDTSFCLHSKELSKDQCKEVEKGNKLPKDGSISGGLNIELVHRKEKSANEILDDVNGILSSDTNPRFVGCESLEAPPAPKGPLVRHSRARRYLEEYMLVAETEDQVDVTGVDFKDMDIVSGGCSSSIDLGDDLVCDTIRSKVEIFYLAKQESVSEEDKEDMYNLLVETINAQVEVGSFGGVGDVTNVQLADTATSGEGGNTDGEDGSAGDTANKDGEDDTEEDVGETTARESPDSSGNEKQRGPIFLAAAGFALLFAGGYWYATSGNDDGEEEKNENTDESESDDDDKTPRRIHQ
eukprot:scaffold5017_cov171-Amphora_coffeaeformis.AAC.25